MPEDTPTDPVPPSLESVQRAALAAREESIATRDAVDRALSTFATSLLDLHARVVQLEQRKATTPATPLALMRAPTPSHPEDPVDELAARVEQRVSLRVGELVGKGSRSRWLAVLVAGVVFGGLQYLQYLAAAAHAH